MPVTIVRTDWIDDDGTGTTGTVINNAWKTELYNQIDQALAKVPMLAGANTFTGNQTVNGVLNVSASANMTFSYSGNGAVGLFLRNPTAGNSASVTLQEGNDVTPGLVSISSYSSTYTPTGFGDYASGTLVFQSGAGLTFNANSGGGKIEFWTANAKRWTIPSTGELLAGPYAAGSAFVRISSTSNGWLEIGGPGTVATNLASFYNANNQVGSIQITGATTAYLTSSDARLKTDRGIARDTSVLERTEIHDYDWISDGTPGRGVFSQDAHKVAPFANAPGTDERDDVGRLVRPWQTDYSKYVPDLIVGWQQHREQLAALRAELDGLKGLN
jgi:hypothetical protein